MLLRASLAVQNISKKRKTGVRVAGTWLLSSNFTSNALSRLPGGFVEMCTPWIVLTVPRIAEKPWKIQSKRILMWHILLRALSTSVQKHSFRADFTSFLAIWDTVRAIHGVHISTNPPGNPLSALEVKFDVKSHIPAILTPVLMFFRGILSCQGFSQKPVFAVSSAWNPVPTTAAPTEQPTASPRRSSPLGRRRSSPGFWGFCAR